MEGYDSPRIPHKEGRIMKRSKRYTANLEKVDKSKVYTIEEAIKLVRILLMLNLTQLLKLL